MRGEGDERIVQPGVAGERASSPEVTRRFAGSGALAVLLLLAALPYIGVLRNDFTYTYDDKPLILDNPYVHNFQHLGEVLSGTLFSNLGAQGGTPYYRPLAMLGFLLCYQAFGPHAFGFHLISVLLNVAVVGILFLFAEELLGDRFAALGAAGLFALHPVHVEAVAWISAVSDLEVTLLYLLAFWLFLRISLPGGRVRPGIAAAMTATFVLAVLAKEQAMTLPVLAVIYEHFYRGDRQQTPLGQKMLRYGPLWLVSLAYLLLRIHVMGSIAHPTQMHPIGGRATVFSAVALAGQYLGKLVWPVHLLAFYPFHASAGFLEWPVLAGAGALGFCAWLFYLLWKRARPASLGLVWLFLTLAPVLNARWMSAYVFGERYLYLPSVGFCLVAGGAGAALWELWLIRRALWRTVAVATVCIVASLCVLRISWRGLDWRDDVTLYQKALAAEPDDYRLHDALGSAYWIRGDAEGAEFQWLTTLRLEPQSTHTLNALGALYARQHRFVQAIPLLERALQMNPRDADAHLYLGAAYAETGKMDRADEQFRAAVSLAPMNFNAHNVLGKLYFDSDRLGEAEQQFRQSLACEPNLAAYDHLGYIYMRRGDRDQAEQAFTAALSMKGTDSHAHFNLGLIYAAAGRGADAVRELQAALAADPNNPQILAALKKLRP